MNLQNYLNQCANLQEYQTNPLHHAQPLSTGAFTLYCYHRIPNHILNEHLVIVLIILYINIILIINVNRFSFMQLFIVYFWEEKLSFFNLTLSIDTFQAVNDCDVNKKRTQHEPNYKLLPPHLVWVVCVETGKK